MKRTASKKRSIQKSVAAAALGMRNRLYLAEALSADSECLTVRIASRRQLKHSALAIAILNPIAALAGIDKPWNETDGGGEGSVIVGLAVLAMLAFLIHLVEKGQFAYFLKDIARGLSFLATIYLVGLCFVASSLVVMLLLRGIGMPEGASGIMGFPLGIFAAYRFFGIYQDWRNPKPRDLP